MNAIKFLERWDKLKPACFQVGKRFSTARKYTPPKFKYYKDLCKRKAILAVELDGKKIGEARLIGIITRQASSINISWWRKDTYAHYTRKDIHYLMQRFYGDEDPFLIILQFRITKVREDE